MKKSIIYFFLPFLFIACNNKERIDNKLQGKVKQESIFVSSKIAGRIEELKITEGQFVRKGDTLAVLNIPELDARIQQAEGAIEATEGQLQLALNGPTGEQLDQLEGQIDAAAAQLDFAEHSFNRMKNMYADSLIPAQQFDEVRSKYQLAQAQLRSLNAKKQELNAGTRPETIRSAKGQLTRAIGSKKELLEAVNEKYLIAPADMQVETISLKVGELLAPGYTLVSGNLVNSTYFRFTITESQVHQFRIGQEHKVQTGFENKSFHAKVIAIRQLPKYAENTSTSPNYKLGETVYELKLEPVNREEIKDLLANESVLLLKEKQPGTN